MTREQPWWYYDSAIPSGARHALVAALSSPGSAHPSWTDESVNALAFRLVQAKARVPDVQALLACDADEVLEVIALLAEEFWLAVPMVAASLTAGITLDDLRWLLARPLAWNLDSIPVPALTLISETPDPAARRLALLIALERPMSTFDATMAFVESVQVGHEEIARYVLDGMSLRDATRTARAQRALDQRAVTARSLEAGGGRARGR